MSTWATRMVRCPCGHELSAQVADGLHVSRLPEVRARILDGTFHRAACPACGELRTIEKKLLYTDFARFHWVGVCPQEWTASWSVLERELLAEFERVVVRAAPPMIQALAPRFVVRLVFGYDQLAEKLHAWDAGLDDRAVELVKLRVLARHPGLMRPGMAVRLLPGAERFELEVRVRGTSDIQRVGCGRQLYDRVVARLDEYRERTPELFEGAFVHLDRVLYPPLHDARAVEAAARWSDLLAASTQTIAPPGGSPGAVLMAPAPVDSTLPQGRPTHEES
ncbi:MAG: hypothetical protein AMXMBFR64_32480 [Myxococcales bacterium]